MYKIDHYRGRTLLFNDIEDLEGIVDADTLELFKTLMAKQDQDHREALEGIAWAVDDVRDKLEERHWHRAGDIELQLDTIYNMIDL